MSFLRLMYVCVCVCSVGLSSDTNEELRYSVFQIVRHRCSTLHPPPQVVIDNAAGMVHFHLLVTVIKWYINENTNRFAPKFPAAASGYMVGGALYTLPIPVLSSSSLPCFTIDQCSAPSPHSIPH